MADVGPSLLAEAVETIRAAFPEEELKTWTAQPEWSAESQAHLASAARVKHSCHD